MTGNS